MTKIGIQGIRGSFSEVAGKHFAEKNNIEYFSLDYLVSSENVLHAVETKKVDYGIFAIENSRGGVVIESIYALAKHRCKIIKLFHIPISQNLLVLPHLQFDEISEVHSHQQALRQCQNFLELHFKGLPLIEEDDTAESARRLKIGELPKTAAVIANRACSEIYGLELIKEDIQDLTNNLTLFLAVTYNV